MRRPRAISWFGFTAFWGHLRHLVASAIATENIDSRQWMIPEAPDVLLGRVVEVLKPGARAGSLAEAMGGEVWVDFVSDTGDDVTVSEVVAEAIAAPYAVDDGGVARTLPRGDVLFLGGDLAYPVATVREITRRLVEPWNAVFERRADGVPRVLLAVPGNHDWYDGLDGFARLCQAPCAFEDLAPVSSADPLHPQPDNHPVLAWAEAFARGDQVKKPSSLALFGYVPVQRTSYFRFPLAPGIDLFAVDRQLKKVDTRQSAFFAVPGAPARVVVVPDPARAWGERRPHGTATLESLGIDVATSPTLLLAGDIHHYERSREGPSTHVVAGGGGAFLHGSRVGPGAQYPVEQEFPGRAASLRLLRELPRHVAFGGAGWLVVTLFAVAHTAALLAELRSGFVGSLSAGLTLSLGVAFCVALLVGWRRHRMVRVVPFAMALGLAIGAIPVGVGVLVDVVAMRVMNGTSDLLSRPVAFVVGVILSTVVSGLLFGATLYVMARLGLNHAQAYAALGGAGYKHFVRLRIAAGDRDGTRPSRIDAWVIGIVDPIASRVPVLVDRFSFAPFERTEERSSS